MSNAQGRPRRMSSCDSMPIRCTYNYNLISIRYFRIDIYCIRKNSCFDRCRKKVSIYLPTKLVFPIVATNHTMDNKYERATAATWWRLKSWSMLDVKMSINLTEGAILTQSWVIASRLLFKASKMGLPSRK